MFLNYVIRNKSIKVDLFGFKYNDFYYSELWETFKNMRIYHLKQYKQLIKSEIIVYLIII